MISRERVLAEATLKQVHDYILEETPVENVVAMFDTVKEFCLG